MVKLESGARRRGMAFLIVLWGLLFLGLLGVAVYRIAYRQIEVGGRLQDRGAARRQCKNGVRALLHLLRQDPSPDVDGTWESWRGVSETLRSAGTEGGAYAVVPAATELETPPDLRRYGVTDEESRLSVNHASLEELARCFVLTGDLASDMAAELAASVVDWRDPDDEPCPGGAEDGYYRILREPYPCKNAPIQSLDELILVRGMTSGLLEKVRAYLTVAGAGSLNFNTAGRIPLQSCGISAETVDNILEYRAGPDGMSGTVDDRRFESVVDIPGRLAAEAGLNEKALEPIRALVAGGRLTVRSDWFRGVVEGRAESGHYRLVVAFVVGRNGDMAAWRPLTVDTYNGPVR